MITFFTTCPSVGVAQRNAIESWGHIDPAGDLIIFGSHDDVMNLARQGWIAAPVDMVHDRPRVDEMFRLADEMSEQELCCYVNTDIILTTAFMDAVEYVAEAFDYFMITGQRWDVKVGVDVTSLEESELTAFLDLRPSLRLHPTSGMDYFCWKGPIWDAGIPAYAVAAYAWDTDLMCIALESGHPVVDITPFHKAYHQDHKLGTRRDCPAAEYNLELLKHGRDDWHWRLRGTQHATHVLYPDGEIVEK